MNALPNDRAAAVHRDLLTAVRDRRAAEHRIAVLLAEVARDGLHRSLVYAGVVPYAVDALGLTVRQVRALLQLGRALSALPALDAAFAEGRVGWTKARELLRVVTPETEAAWVARAEAVDSRTLEREVGATPVGHGPPTDEVPAKGEPRARLVFEMEAHEAQLVREALALVRAQAGVHRAEVGDGALLAEVARRVLHDVGGAEPVPTGERWRVVLEHCPTCRTTAGRDHEASETVAREACCDAEVVDARPGPAHGRLTRTLPPRVRRAVLHRDRERCRAPGCRCTLWVDVHHVIERHRGGAHVTGNLVALCPAHHRLVHEGLLAIRGDADGEIEFERADGRVVASRPTWVHRDAPPVVAPPDPRR